MWLQKYLSDSYKNERKCALKTTNNVRIFYRTDGKSVMNLIRFLKEKKNSEIKETISGERESRRPKKLKNVVLVAFRTLRKGMNCKMV